MDFPIAEEIKRHIDVVADGLRTEVRTLVASETTVLRGDIQSVAAELRSEIQGVASDTVGLRGDIREVAERGEEIKRSLGALSESIRTDVRTVTEGFVLTNERLDRIDARVSEEFSEMKAMIRLSFDELDRRISSRQP